MMPSQRKAICKRCPLNALRERAERPIVNVPAKDSLPLWVIKRQLDHRKVRRLELTKKSSQQLVLFAPINLWEGVRNRICAALQASAHLGHVQRNQQQVPRR